MGQIFNPPAAVSPQSITSLAYGWAFANQNAGTTDIQGEATSYNHTGTVSYESIESSGLGDIARTTVSQNASLSQAGFIQQSSVPPFRVGNAANDGGFYIEIYAGTGNNKAVSNSSYFIGLSSSNNPNFAAGAPASDVNDLTGMVVNSPNNTSGITSWASVWRRGAGAAVVTNFSPTITVAANQLFALQFILGPNSDAILMTIKQLTAAGVWTTILTQTSLAGIGPAKGTNLWPSIAVGVFANLAGNGDSVTHHRTFAIINQYSVGRAFAG